MVKAASAILGGKGGGGRKDFAQAGGVDKNKIEEAFKGIFKKIVTMPIENELNTVSADKLYKIATENKFNSEKSKNFTEALKKISSSEKKLIVCFGSLYNCGNILNKN